MRHTIYTLTFLLISSFATMAQITSSINHQDASCWYTNDGSMNIDSIEGCFAPIEITIDSNIYVINHLKNDAYTHLNHGSGAGEDRAYSVWAGNTSVGDVYIATGTFVNSVSFDTLSFSAAGSLDMFTVCYDANTGGVLWAFTGGTTGPTFTAGYAITGANDKAYVTGYFTGSCQMGNFNIVSTGGYQAYLAKIDIPTGNVDTVTQYGESNVQEGFNINYADGRLYLVGNFQDSINIGGNMLNATGGLDGFIACIDTNMSTEYWSAAVLGNNSVIMNDVVPFSNGGTVEKAFIVGSYNSATTFGTNSLTAIGGNDFFVAAIDTTGSWLWAEQGGSTGADFCTSIDINSSGDRLYLGGSWTSTMNFGGSNFTASTGDDGFIAYMDTAGVLDSLYVFAGTGVEQVKDLQSVDDDFLIFTATMNAGLTYADSTFASNGGSDAFVGKIGKDFHEIWGKNFGGSAGDQFASVRTGPNDRYHVAGYFQNDASSYQAGLVSAGGFDVIVSNDFLMGQADTSIAINNLLAGTYFVNYLDSNGNALIDTVFVGPDSIIAVAGITNASSPTANDGAIDLTVSGGTPGYTFLWNNGMMTEDLDSLTAGVYCVTITDSNGCIDSSNCFTVDSTTAGGMLMVSGAVQDLACFNDSSGAIDVTITGANGAVTIAWSNGATTEDLNGLAAGVYTISVTDNDTTINETFTVNEPPQIVVNGVITPPSTGTAIDGAINVTTTGGVPPFNFSWSNGETTEDLDSLMVGIYTLTVTDSSGCQVITSFAVDTLPALSLVSISSDVTCLTTNNGSIDLTVIGGAPSFTFAWSNGETTEDIFGLAAGVYTVTVTDSANQTATLTDTIASDPIFPDPVVGPITGGNSVQAWTNYNYNVPSSNGSSFDWTVSGGSLVSAASNAAIVQWNAGPSGIVYVTETDVNGCIASDSLAVNILFVGIGERHEHAIAVFPNPTVEDLFIQLPVGLDLPIIRIFDINGQVVATYSVNDYNPVLPMGHLPAGAYFIDFEYKSLGVQVHHKVIKQ